MWVSGWMNQGTGYKWYGEGWGTQGLPCLSLYKETYPSGIPGTWEQWENLVQGRHNLVEEEQFREHLNKLNVHNCMGPDKLHSRVIRKLADTADIFYCLWIAIVTRRGSWWLEERKYHSHLQEGKNKSRNYRPVSPLSLGGDRENLSGKHFWVHGNQNRQEGDRDWSARIYKGKNMLDQSDSLLQWYD